jgi:hypothetical protein
MSLCINQGTDRAALYSSLPGAGQAGGNSGPVPSRPGLGNTPGLEHVTKTASSNSPSPSPPGCAVCFPACWCRADSRFPGRIKEQVPGKLHVLDAVFGDLFYISPSRHHSTACNPSALLPASRVASPRACRLSLAQGLMHILQ